MSRNWWIVVILVACGVGLAVLIGVLGTRNEPSKTEAVNSLCTSLKGLDSSIKTLTSLDASTATQSEVQTDVNGIQTAWDQVQSDAQAVQNAPTGSLDSAWNDFESAVKGIPNASSVSDAATSVQQAGQQLESAAKSTASSLSCSS